MLGAKAPFPSLLSVSFSQPCALGLCRKHACLCILVSHRACRHTNGPSASLCVDCLTCSSRLSMVLSSSHTRLVLGICIVIVRVDTPSEIDMLHAPFVSLSVCLSICRLQHSFTCMTSPCVCVPITYSIHVNARVFPSWTKRPPSNPHHTCTDLFPR